MDNPRLQNNRRSDFARWWRKNRMHTKAHTWLAHHARNTCFTYALPPESFTHIQSITKRYFKSEHRRMSQGNAWALWRITHPLHFERIGRLKTHAAFLMIQNEQFKNNKRDAKGER